MDWGQEAGSSGSSSFLSPVHRRQEHTSSRVAMWGRLKIPKDGAGGGGRGKFSFSISTQAASLPSVYILKFCVRIYLEGKRGFR